MSGDDEVPPEAEPEAVTEAVEEPSIEEQLASALAAAESAQKEIGYRDAEIDNIRKRHAKDRSDIIRYGSQGLARKLIPLINDFDRALEAMPAETDEVILEGVRMIRANLEAALIGEGARQIDAAGQPFDPNTMEAITTIPPTEEHPAGMVVEVLESGWMLHDRVLRPARVVVTAVE
uniref:Protein GrpE n=1 Tax=uncultured marine group II/III euryarchaeote KM3_57_F04 TaxID=1456465 RepID=A0A075H8V1_9EURY|nr:heat shock protein (GRPE) [uncultured marine group II/III euryarchaeote KM3_57_F04]